MDTGAVHAGLPGAELVLGECLDSAEEMVRDRDGPPGEERGYPELQPRDDAALDDARLVWAEFHVLPAPQFEPVELTIANPPDDVLLHARVLVGSKLAVKVAGDPAH